MKAEGWARSGFSDVDLNKLKKVGLLLKVADLVIPGDKIIPRPDDGFWVLFLSFIYRELSLSPPRIPSWSSLRLWRAAALAM
jgi:hypothetical protein